MIAYLEDAPADTGTVARGLSKAIVPLLRCIDTQVEYYFVHQTHGRIPAAGMPAFVRSKLIEGSHQGRLARNAWKFATVFPLRIGLFLSSLFSPRPATKPLSDGADYLWVPVGVDPGTLVRAWTVARRTSLPLHIYFVDDLEAHPSNAGVKNLRRLVARVARDAARVYTITNELGDLFEERYGIKTRRLPLIPELYDQALSTSRVEPVFAVYLGSVNHLYEDGLRELIAAVGDLHKTLGLDLKLRLFSSTEDIRRICDGKIPSWIVAGPENDDALVRQQIEAANLCFLPCSFLEEARTMATTSFPSKLLDYLIGARAIVVFAPDYSIAYKTLNAHRVPYVVSTTEELNGVLASLVSSQKMHKDAYRSLLELHFGPKTVRQAIGADWN